MSTVGISTKTLTKQALISKRNRKNSEGKKMNTQSKNKLLAVLSVVLLVASMALAVAPVNAAIADGTVTTPATGNSGSEITITGTGATAGGPIQVYWNTQANLLGEVYATGAGAFTIKVTVPVAAAGDYYLLVKDGGTIVSKAFSIVPKITLSSPSGIPGDVITVTGTGFNASKNIALTLIVEACRKFNMPICVGTEMNKLGLPFVDDFSAPELQPYVQDFVDGARCLYAHTVLSRFADFGYLSPAAHTAFGQDVAAKNKYFTTIGRQLWAQTDKEKIQSLIAAIG